jgi:RHS repeat-associated protein
VPEARLVVAVVRAVAAPRRAVHSYTQTSTGSLYLSSETWTQSGLSGTYWTNPPPSVAIAYTMDAGGNVSRGSNTFVPATDQISGGSYDAAGDLLQWNTSLGTAGVDYDLLTRLTYVGYTSEDSPEILTTNVFDPLGLRNSRNASYVDGAAPATNDAYVYDGSTLIDRDSSGVSEYYIWGPTGLIQEFGATQGNGSLSPVAIYAYNFDPNGNTVDRADDYPNQSGYRAELDLPSVYDAYGELVWKPNVFIPGNGFPDYYFGSIPEPLVHRYKGQYGYVTDTESNLIYCQNRFYDPYSARWLTRDPSGLDGGINTYQYCLGDPINNVDPNGLMIDTGAIEALLQEEEKLEGAAWRRKANVAEAAAGLITGFAVGLAAGTAGAAKLLGDAVEVGTGIILAEGANGVAHSAGSLAPRSPGTTPAQHLKNIRRINAIQNLVKGDQAEWYIRDLLTKQGFDVRDVDPIEFNVGSREPDLGIFVDGKLKWYIEVKFNTSKRTRHQVEMDGLLELMGFPTYVIHVTQADLDWWLAGDLRP